MPIQLNDQLLAQLQADVGQDGKVTFTGLGTVDPEKNELVIEAINDVPVEYTDAEKESPTEDGMSSEEAPEEEMSEADKKKPGMAVIMAFKKAAGYKK